MTGTIEVPRDLLNAALDLSTKARKELRALLSAPVVERQPTGQWRIPVNGDWFYGTKEQCERERAEYETTFTAEDYAEAGVVAPEQIWSSPPAPVAADESQALLDRHNAWMAGVENGKASLVLPDRKEVDRVLSNGTRIHDAGAIQWNACLDKLKELNQ